MTDKSKEQTKEPRKSVKKKTGAGKGLLQSPSATAPSKREPKRYAAATVPSKREPVSDGMPARRVALRVLREVTENGAYAALSLDRVLKQMTLSEQDTRLVARLVYDTLDHICYIDHALKQVMAREDTDIRLRNILRLGACQLLLEDRIPESAATNTAVQLCTDIGIEGLKGVCNGILRNLIRKKDELNWPDPEREPDEAMHIRCSLPIWLIKRLKQDYGGEAERVMSYRRRTPAVTLRPNLTRLDDDGFEKLLEGKGWEKSRSDVPHAWLVSGAANPAQDPDFGRGLYSIESEGSMLACFALEAKRGQHILDACAAPGGKTCLTAEIMNGSGRVQAWDVHEHRVKLIAAQAARLGLENIRPMVRDATKYREDMQETMDAVLIDAPCSGLGVMAEKPDIRLRVTEEGTDELVLLQKRLLDTVCNYVRPGGLLVYSTCSVLKDENEKQIVRFLDNHPEFELCALPDTVPERLRRYENTGLQILPHRDGMEGFFICRMRRKDARQ